MNIPYPIARVHEVDDCFVQAAFKPRLFYDLFYFHSVELTQMYRHYLLKQIYESKFFSTVFSWSSMDDLCRQKNLRRLLYKPQQKITLSKKEKMRNLFFLLIWASPFFSFSQRDSLREFEMKDGDSTYIMKQYYLVLYLRASDAPTHTPEELKEIQAGHMAHIGKMAEENVVYIAGPFGDNTEKRGILILDVATEEEVHHWLKEDPAVKAGRLTYEFHPWWGAKGSVLK